MPEEIKNIDPRIRAAAYMPNTFNEDQLTVDVVCSTDAPVLQRTWDGNYNEVLDMQPASVRLTRFNAGANVLDNHNKYDSVRDVVLGVIKRAWVDGNKLYATIQLSRRAELQGFIQDVKDGIVHNLSIGYRIYKMLVDETTDIPTATATDWEPFELSFVSVPADFNAQTRSDNANWAPNQVTVISQIKNRTMAEEVVIPAAAPAPAATAAPAAAPTVNVDEVRNEGAKQATIRATEILNACRAAKMDEGFAITLISDDKMTVDAARAAILNKMAAGQTPAPRNTYSGVVGEDETVKQRNAVEFALLNRADANQFKIGDANNAASTLAVDFRGISVLDAAKMLLNQRGIAVTGFNKQEIYQRSMSTSDFPNLLSNIANKFLRKEYAQMPQTFKAIASQQNLPDFKSVNGIQFGGPASFDLIPEGGEFKNGAFVETVDNWKLATYGKIFRFTRQMMINDDLAAFVRAAKLIAIGAANNESDVFWSLISNNTKTGDGVALFHSSHGNLAGSGAVISATTLSDARTAMRRQKGLTTKELIEVMPKYLVVAPEQETAADQIITGITPNQTSSVNPFQNSLQKVVEVRLAATAWYLFADPNTVGSFTYGYLDGNEGLYTETDYGFEIDGVAIKARQDFAAKVWDYRGSYKNPGA